MTKTDLESIPEIDIEKLDDANMNGSPTGEKLARPKQIGEFNFGGSKRTGYVLGRQGDRIYEVPDPNESGVTPFDPEQDYIEIDNFETYRKIEDCP